jgi:hypothetical protein
VNAGVLWCPGYRPVIGIASGGSYGTPRLDPERARRALEAYERFAQDQDLLLERRRDLESRERVEHRDVVGMDSRVGRHERESALARLGDE